ncbi:MAG: DUF493 family protein [Oligoflexus sp.]
MNSFDKQSFQDKLDATHSWPGHYTFKFIIPTDDREKLSALLPMGSISERLSKNGKYTSVSLRCVMSSSSAVMSVYEDVSQLEGVIAL